MKRLEYEVERDTIEASYAQKLNDFDKQLLELDHDDADLQAQFAGNQMRRCSITALRNELVQAERDEQLKLKREYMLNQED